LPFVKTGMTSVLFDAAKVVCVHKLGLKTKLSKGTKISEQPFRVKLGMRFIPTDFLRNNRLIALLTSSSLIMSI